MLLVVRLVLSSARGNVHSWRPGAGVLWCSTRLALAAVAGACRRTLPTGDADRRGNRFCLRFAMGAEHIEQIHSLCQAGLGYPFMEDSEISEATCL